MNADGEQHWTVRETERWLATRTDYRWAIWRGEQTKRWWAVPLWRSAPIVVVDARHHRELEAAMREMEQQHDGTTAQRHEGQGFGSGDPA